MKITQQIVDQMRIDKVNGFIMSSLTKKYNLSESRIRHYFNHDIKIKPTTGDQKVKEHESEIINLYVNKKMSSVEIAKKFDIPKYKSVTNMLKSKGITLISHVERIVSKDSSEKLKDRKWLENELKTKNISKIGDELNVSHATVTYYINKFKLEFRNIKFGKDLTESVRLMSDEQWMKQKYEMELLSMGDIGTILDVDERTVAFYFKKFNIKIRKNPGRYKNFIKSVHLISDKDWCIDQYKTQQKPLRKIAKELGVNEDTLSLKFRDHGIIINNSYQRSLGEIELFKFVESIYPDIVPNYRFDIRSEIDIFIPDLNIGIDFFGDVFHANPSIFSADNYIKKLDMLASEKWDQDFKRNEKIKNIGMNHLVVWEYEWNNNTESVKNKIKEFLSIT